MTDGFDTALKATLKTIRLPHSSYSDAVTLMDKCIQQARKGCPLHLAIGGDPGTGKSTLASEFAGRYQDKRDPLPGRYVNRAQSGLIIGLPSNPTHKEIQALVLHGLKDRAPGIGFGRGPWEDRVARVAEHLFLPFLGLDECHHMFLDNEFQLSPHAYHVRNFLKLLTDALPCPLVLLGLTQIKLLLSGDKQLLPRIDYRHELAPLRLGVSITSQPTPQDGPTTESAGDSGPTVPPAPPHMSTFEQFALSYQDEVVRLFALREIPDLENPERMIRLFYVTLGNPRHIRNFYLHLLLDLPEDRRAARIVTEADFARAAGMVYFEHTAVAGNGFLTSIEVICESLKARGYV